MYAVVLMLCISDGVGILYTLPGIDYEKITSYNLTIIASDLGDPVRSSATYVLVNVTNLPDEVPHFDMRVYTVYIQDTFPVGSVVTTVDAGPGLFTFSILGISIIFVKLF